VVLLSAVDTTVKQNAIGDNYYDGVDILDASQNNLLDANQIESQEGPSSTGVLLQGSGDLFPLGNTLSTNEIRRNHVDVLISGARATRLTGNSITAIGERTAVLLAIGNASGAGGPRFGQPSGTIFRTNKLYDDGECAALRGCAIRLLPGVTVTVDATQNDFGVSAAVDIQAAVWDHARDPELGTVLFGGPLGAPVVLTATPAATQPVFGVAPARQNGATLAAAAPVVGVVTAGVTAGATVGATPQATRAVVATATPVAASPTATPSGSASSGAAPPIAYLDAGSGAYYVELTLCVTDAGGQPVAADVLAVSFFDGTGASLGTAHATADTGGCFKGDVQPGGAGAEVQPATVMISDASGGTTSLGVSLGAPLVRPPRNSLPTP
jgi:hypothetical protein